MLWRPHSVSIDIRSFHIFTQVDVSETVPSGGCNLIQCFCRERKKGNKGTKGQIYGKKNVKDETMIKMVPY